MAKLRHIAIATQNAEETAKFYVEVFGMTQLSSIETPIVSGAFLTDGTIIWRFWILKTIRSPAPSGAKTGAASTTSALRLKTWKTSLRSWPRPGVAPVMTSTRRWAWAWGVATTATPRSGIAGRTA